jgi:transglutaminase-like putative cysteine protease
MKKVFLILLSLAIIFISVLALSANAKPSGLFSTYNKVRLNNSVSAILTKAEGEAGHIYSEVSSELSSSFNRLISDSRQLIQDASSNIPAEKTAQEPQAKIQQNSSQPAPVESNINTTPPAPPSGSTGSGASTGYWGQTGISGLKVYEYGKSLLNGNEQNAYDQIASAVLSLKSSVTIKTNLAPLDMEKILQYYINDHPELFYYSGVTMSYLFSNQNSGQKIYESYTFSFEYSLSGSTIAAMRVKIGEAAAPMLAEAGKYANDYDKEKSLHDALIESCNYDLNAAKNPAAYPESFTAYGALVNKTAVCEGYAKAMKLLLDSAGIESLYVTGTASNSEGAGSHAWNMVNVSGKWYYLDATFDDPLYVNASGQYIDVNKTSYTYFNFISMPDHSLGMFDASNPYDPDSQNYGVMPAVG